MHNGHCLCFRVRFAFESTPIYVSACHCSICRHITGSAFAAYVNVADADLTLTSGADQLATYEVSGKSSIQFCQSCGSTVFTRHSDYADETFVALGAMEQTADIRLMYHEFVGSKADWFEILDSLPQFERSAEPE